MKKSRLIIFIIIGGILGFSIHLVWHLSAGINLFSAGPHVISGVVFTLIGMIIGIIFYFIIPNKKDNLPKAD